MTSPTDSDVKNLIAEEKKRLQEGLELIPSENVVSKEVMAALGSVLTNKYSEGYPYSRYYGGNEVIDKIEVLAQERAKQLFGAEHVNVQPYSGSPANIEAYSALVPLGGKIMGMSLAHGGHLTHGHKVSFSGQAWQFVHYGVDEKTHLLDYEKIREIALREKPAILLCGATAYPRTIDFSKFHAIAKECGAIAMADISHISGLIAAGIHASPLPDFDVVTTTTHKTLRGPRGAMILCKKEYATKIDKAVFPGFQGGPHNHQTAAIAVALGEALQPSFKAYAQQIVSNSKALASSLIAQGCTLITGGSDNHLILIDVSGFGLTGKEAEDLLGKAGITVNKNMIPYDKRTPLNPSGIRIGTPAITTRGMKEKEMEKIGQLIATCLTHKDEPTKQQKVREEVKTLCTQFPLDI